MPINAERAVQTGAKTQLGGFRGDFVSPAYQPGTAGAVKRDPMIPAPSQISTAANSLRPFFMTVSLSWTGSFSRPVKLEIPERRGALGPENVEADRTSGRRREGEDRARDADRLSSAER